MSVGDWVIVIVTGWLAADLLFLGWLAALSRKRPR